MRGDIKLKSNLDNLRMIAFEGAGVTGVLYVGAMKALQEAELLGKVELFAGTSSGAIVAMASSLGYRGDGLQAIALAQDFRSFCRMNHKWLKDLRQNLARKGVFSGDELRRWLDVTCARRIGKASLTFADLIEYKQKAESNDMEFFSEQYEIAMNNKAVTSKRARSPHKFSYDFERSTVDESISEMQNIAKTFIALEVSATEVIEKDDGEPLESPTLFNAINSPDISIASAVRASATYPYVFRQAEIEWSKGNVKSYKDGAFTIPIPISSFDSDSGLSFDVLGFTSEYLTLSRNDRYSGFLVNKLKNLLASTIGKQLKDKRNIAGETAMRIGLKVMRNDYKRFLSVSRQSQSDVNTASRVIALDRLGIAGNDFEVSDEQKVSLIDLAYKTTQQVINKVKR